MAPSKTKRGLAVLVLLFLGVVTALALRPAPGPKVRVQHPGVPLPDGARLGATVLLPDPLPQSKVPAVLIQTRYWRAFALRFPDAPGQVPPMPREPIAEKLLAAGYAVVLVDVRGTGASEGRWPHPFSHQEVLDAGEVVRWVARQPWCNGAVGTTGVSYEGSTALLAAATAGPALKAVLARQIEWDLLDELLAPGGVRNISFPAAWSDSVDALDRNVYPDLFPALPRLVVRGVHPLDDDPEGKALHILVDRRACAHVDTAVQQVRAPSDAFGAAGPAVSTLGPSAWSPQLAQTQAAVGLWGSYWDSATADAVLRATAAMPVAEAVLGGWNHEGDAAANPLDDPSTPLVELDEVVRFFDRHLRQPPAGGRPTLRRWFVAGEGRMEQGADWPSTRPQTWVLQPGGQLARTTDAAVQAALQARIDWNADATTGTENRWMSGMLRPVRYGDRRKAEGTSAWHSEPLVSPLRMFGHASLTCAVDASAPAAALHVYLEAELPSGAVRYLSEGLLRVTHGTVTVPLRAVAASLPAGWRLRVAVAAGDAGTFERVPASGASSVTLSGTPSAPCVLTLPVRGNSPN